MLKSIPFYNSLLKADLGNKQIATHAHVLIYGAIEVHSWGKLGCIASNETIGSSTGMTKNTVAKCLSQIAKAGWVQVELKNGKRTKILPLLEIATPLPHGKPPFTVQKTPLYRTVNIDNILDNNEIENNVVPEAPPSEPSKKEEVKKEFVLEEKLQDMEKNKGNYLDHIASYIRFKSKELVITNSQQLSLIITTFVKAGKKLEGTSSERVYRAMDQLERKYQHEKNIKGELNAVKWNLYTVIKELSK